MNSEELQEKGVVCRKPHHCEWCGEIIAAGERARYRAFIYDGDFGHGWMHLECREAYEITGHECGEFEFTFGCCVRGTPL